MLYKKINALGRYLLRTLFKEYSAHKLTNHNVFTVGNIIFYVQSDTQTIVFNPWVFAYGRKSILKALESCKLCFMQSTPNDTFISQMISIGPVLHTTELACGRIV